MISLDYRIVEDLCTAINRDYSRIFSSGEGKGKIGIRPSIDFKIYIFLELGVSVYSRTWKSDSPIQGFNRIPTNQGSSFDDLGKLKVTFLKTGF